MKPVAVPVSSGGRGGANRSGEISGRRNHRAREAGVAGGAGDRCPVPGADKKFPGNITRSYRSGSPFRVVGEVADWQGHSPERLKQVHDSLAELKRQGARIIED
jgi:hypothetical protein